MINMDTPIFLRVARIVFWAAVVFTFISAVMPPHAAPKLFPWDKAEHFAAFYVLAVLCAAAFPRQGLLSLGIALSAFGAGIELVQALPIVNRDCDIYDWVADTIAILAAFAPLTLARWRLAFSKSANV